MLTTKFTGAALVNAENPILSPVTPADDRLALLANAINRENRRRTFSESQLSQQRARAASSATPVSLPSPIEENSDCEDNDTTPKGGSPAETAESSPTRAATPVDTSLTLRVQPATSTRAGTVVTTGDLVGFPEQVPAATSFLDQLERVSTGSTTVEPEAAHFLNSYAYSRPDTAANTADPFGSQSSRPTQTNPQDGGRSSRSLSQNGDHSSCSPSQNGERPSRILYQQGDRPSRSPSTDGERSSRSPSQQGESSSRSHPSSRHGDRTQQYLPHLTHPVIHFFEPPDFSGAALRGIMNASGYPTYLDSPTTGPNPRQAPPSPSQGMGQNGMNGGMGLGGAMVGFPTPAGHQSDLNFIMNMVEELSGELSRNRVLVGDIVEKMGKVRAKAKNMDLSNDELLTIAASELNSKHSLPQCVPAKLTESTVSSENLEKENSELRKALEKARHGERENWKLAYHGANILRDIADKMHEFKANHEKETLQWHSNYRKQLEIERAENLLLRDQIQDKIATAARANEHLRQMRRYVTDHPELHELRVENDFLRKDRRSWKRMALPLIPDDDSEWSDDDDLIDPEEKKRKAAEEAEKEIKDTEGGQDGDAAGPHA